MAEKMKAGAAARAKIVGVDTDDSHTGLHVVDDKSGEGTTTTFPEPAFRQATDYVGRTLHVQQSTLDAFDDWVEVQRRKKRRREIVNEPSNVQECADHIMRLGLAQLGNHKPH